MSEHPKLGREKKKPALIALLVLLALAFLVLVFSIAYYMGSAKNNTTAQESSSAPKTSASTSQDASELPQGVNQITDEQGKKLIKSFYRTDPKDPRAIGNPTAPVTMVQFSDFSCPLCYQYESTVFKQLKPYIDNGTLRIEFNNLSIFAAQYHSDLAATGAIAASKQGKFWQFLEQATQLATKQGGGHISWDDQLVTQLAKSSGVSDLTQFNKDLKSADTRKIVEDESTHARSVGINGTPAFFINDYFISGSLPADTFIKTIEIAAKQGNNK